MLYKTDPDSGHSSTSSTDTERLVNSLCIYSLLLIMLASRFPFTEAPVFASNGEETDIQLPELQTIIQRIDNCTYDEKRLALSTLDSPKTGSKAWVKIATDRWISTVLITMLLTYCTDKFLIKV